MWTTVPVRGASLVGVPLRPTLRAVKLSLRDLALAAWLVPLATGCSADGGSAPLEEGETDTEVTSSGEAGVSDGDSSSSQSSTGGDAPVELGPCESLVDCATAANTPVTPLVAIYGPNGTCWEEFTQEQCWQDCRAQKAALAPVANNAAACLECIDNDDCVFDPSKSICFESACVAETTLVECSLEAVAPDATNPIVAGDAVGQIPTEVGAALARSCGCHFTSTTTDPYFPYSGGMQMATLQDFQGPYPGGNGAYAGLPTWRAVEDRVVVQGSMPPAVCETTDGASISDADLALFTAWFEQEVPDGSGFTPPG